MRLFSRLSSRCRSPFSSHSPFLGFASLRFIKSRRDPCICPAPINANHLIGFIATGQWCMSGSSLPHTAPSPYRVTCVLVKLSPPTVLLLIGLPSRMTPPTPFTLHGTLGDSSSSCMFTRDVHACTSQPHTQHHCQHCHPSTGFIEVPFELHC